MTSTRTSASQTAHEPFAVRWARGSGHRGAAGSAARGCRALKVMFRLPKSFDEVGNQAERHRAAEVVREYFEDDLPQPRRGLLGC
jgi:hypothetical protein